MKVRKALAAGGLVTVSLLGGAIGATAFGTADAATATPAPSSGTATTAPSQGKFHSNEDPAHEAGESAAREAAENNGTATYGTPSGSAAN